MTSPKMYGCRDSETPKEKSPPTNEKGTTTGGGVDTAIKRPTFSEFVEAIQRRADKS